MKALSLLILVCLLALGATVYAKLAPDPAADAHVPAVVPDMDSHADARRAELLATRRSCSMSSLDAFVAEQRRCTQAGPRDKAALHLLAEALLERVLLRTARRGMVVGEPLYAELPPATGADIDEGLQCITRARELGDVTSENYRIEAALLSNRITGLTAAVSLNGRIQGALAKAAQLDGSNPALHVALGLRKLLAPPLLGNAPDEALAHLEFAAKAMPYDERPQVFAAMAEYLERKRQKAIDWLQQAVARNPNNVFARVVLQRLRRGEDEPFARDVTVAEAAAAK
jgi:tetratricopeptide (TPR) repeat protein